MVTCINHLTSTIVVQQKKWLGIVRTVASHQSHQTEM